MLIVEIDEIIMRTVSTIVDLEKYSGKWFVIASIPYTMEKDWNFITQDYELTKKGTFNIYTSYVKQSKTKRHTIKSIGFPQKSSSNFKWKTQLLWPFKRDYIIEELPEDYSYVVIGDPERKHLHILSRSNYINIDQYLEIVKRCQGRGYDVSKIKRIPQ